MGRWEPDSRGRLERAALELFAERGFEQTTVAEIAARAGVTERTFFRQFADKREVLFGGGTTLQDLLVRAVEEAAEPVLPMAAVAAGLEAAAGVLQERRELVPQRQAVIAANAELHERELAKLAAWAAAVAEALRRRGVEEPAASLSAELGMAAFRVAVGRWAQEDGDRPLAAVVAEALEGLRAVVATT